MARGERVGVLEVRLFQPFPSEALLAALPRTVRSIAVLDRTKEPGAVGEPLYLEVVAALHEAMAGDEPPFERLPRVVGGRYGLSSKELTPSMVKPIYDELAAPRPTPHFTVGIVDDVTHLSLPIDRVVPARAARGRGLGRVLRPRQRRHGRREQGVGEDHRRAHRAARPGLLRLRLEEVGLGHRLPPPVRPRADPVDLPDRGGRLRRLPPVRPAGQGEGRRGRPPRRDAPAQRALRPGRGLGADPRRRPATARREADRAVGHRRRGGREGRRHGQPDQHGHAAVLLPARERPARPTRRSRGSRTSSRPPTPSAATRSWRGTSPRSTGRWPRSATCRSARRPIRRLPVALVRCRPASRTS